MTMLQLKLFSFLPWCSYVINVCCLVIHTVLFCLLATSQQNMLTPWMHDCEPMTSLSCIFVCAALYRYMKNDIHLIIVGYYYERSVTTVTEKYTLHLCKIMEVYLLCHYNYWLTVVTSPWSMMYKILISNGMRI